LTRAHQVAIFRAVRARFFLARLALLGCLAAPVLAAQQPPPAAGAQDAGSGYHVRPGDVLRIVVWGQEAYSGEYRIDERGVLEYPIIGEIQATDLTVAELRDRIRRGLETIFNNPFVSVRPQFRMAVLGEVRAPGLYVVDPTLSVLDVVAMAGGPTPSGNLNRVQLLRGGQELQLGFGSGQGSLRGRTLQEIGVRSGDQIVVRRKAFSREDLLLLLQVVQIVGTVALIIRTY
jgi:polysaccharide export outer membrane protein